MHIYSSFRYLKSSCLNKLVFSSTLSLLEDFEQNIKLLDMINRIYRYDIYILEKGRHYHITKQLMHSFEVNIRMGQPSKVMSISASPRVANPDVYLKIMYQLYIVPLQKLRARSAP